MAKDDLKIDRSWLSEEGKRRLKKMKWSSASLDGKNGYEDEENDEKQEENLDQGVYDDSPEATQEDDTEEDLALLEDEDTDW